MSPLIVLLGLAGIAVLMWLVTGWMRESYRARLRAVEFPPAWRAILEREVPIYRRLPLDLRERLHADMNVFLAEKRFSGCGGLEITDEMRLIVASQACLLQINQRNKYYPTFTSILIHPRTYVAQERRADGTVGDSVRAGESWRRGPLVLSWSDARSGVANPKDGHNVILHEFAHKLDEQDGRVDGAPELPEAQGRSWPVVFCREFKRLQKRVARRHKTVMDAYGATEPAEFFAVAVESFFEKPHQLRDKRPELYEELRNWSGLDPASWPS